MPFFYMDQHYETLDPNLTVLEAITEAQSRGGSAPGNDRGKQIQAARDLLASLLFRGGADVHKRISVLSWGVNALVYQSLECLYPIMT